MCRHQTVIPLVTIALIIRLCSSSRVREYRAQEAGGGLPVLYLNAGDTYTGTPWFAIYKDNITAAFLNILKPDAIVSLPPAKPNSELIDKPSYITNSPSAITSSIWEWMVWCRS